MKQVGIVSALVVILVTAGCGTGTEPGDPEEVGGSTAALGAAPQIRSVEIEPGVHIEYREQGRRHGQDVIFIPGYTDSHRSFSRNLPIFPRRFHVYAMDQRGHGGSSKPSCCYTQDAFAADVVAFMDALDIESASLVGHSMGSFVAHHVAVDYPDRVDKLVLVGSAPTAAGNEVILGFQTVVDTLEDPIDPAFVRDFQSSTFFRPVPERFIDTAVTESLRMPAPIWQSALDGLVAEDHSAELSGITAPTLILWGDQDGFFSFEEQQQLDSLIPDSRLVVYEQTGHGLHVERPLRFVFDVAHFLRKRRHPPWH